MNEYLLDTNVVIGLWKHNPQIIDNLIEDKKIKILKEISEELVVKESRRYKGQQVLSERFCKLLSFIVEADKNRSTEFYNMIHIKYSQKGNAYLGEKFKLSENDLLLLFTCYYDEKLILVTEDKYLFNAAKHILGEEKVISLKILIDREEGHEL